MILPEFNLIILIKIHVKIELKKRIEIVTHCLKNTAKTKLNFDTSMMFI